MIGAQSSSRPATGASTAPQDRSHLSQPKPTTFNRDQVPRGVGIGVAIGGSDVTPDPTPNASPQRRNGRVRAGSNAEMTRDASIWTRGKAIPAGIRVDVPSGMGTGMEGISRYGPNGHGGTNFTVGNVSNGMLYLRPVIRSNAELRQNFILPPSTPPSSAEEADSCSTRLPYQSSPPKTPTHISPQFPSTATGVTAASPQSTLFRRHGRSRSHTLGTSISSILPPTQVQIHIQAPPDSDIGIDQLDGPSRQRPRTSAAEDNFDALDVHIPRYNLGSPRFSPGGTPFLYAQFGSNSSFLPSVSGEFGSSTSASRQPSPGGGKGQWIFPTTTAAAAVAGVSPLADSRTESPPLSLGGMINREITASIMSTIAPAQPLSIPSASPSPGLAPSPIPPFMERTASGTSAILPPIPSPPVPPRFGPLNIDPTIWDPLATSEGMDNPETVLYHTTPSTSNIPGALLNREIRAATPLRIVAQITSPDFVDYHLLSDFFLTYRLFMNSSSLAEMLFSRLKWALARGQDQEEARQMQGKVVRVRAFVAIRHWILNYFADDFVPFMQFRREFVRALNDVTLDILKRQGKQKATSATAPPSAEMRILAELKRCWRRTCALYWDTIDATNNPDKLDNYGPEVPITPGGPPGTRDDAIRHSVASLRRAGKLPPVSPPPQIGSLLSGNVGSEDSFLRDVVKPAQPPSREPKSKQPDSKATKSPATSLGRKSGAAIAAALRKANLKDKEEKTKSDPGSVYSAAIRSPPSISGSISTSASPRVGGHKRSGSFSDALRDERAPLPLQPTTANPSMFAAGMPYAGSLVRGNQFGPIPATVGGFIAPASSTGDYSAYGTITTISTMANAKEASPGMRRLIGTVKKAFGAGGGANSSSQAAQSPKRKGSVAKSEKSVSSNSSKRTTHHNSGSLGSASGSFATTTGGLSGIRDDGTVRIDVLGAKAMEKFLKTMERIQAEEADGESSSILTDKTDSRKRDSSTTGITSRLSSTVNKLSAGGFVMSGALSGMMDGSPDIRGKSTAEGFLDSPSTMPGTPTEQVGDRKDYIGVETFLTDRSTEYSASDRGSYLGDEIPPMPMIPLHLGKQISAEKERKNSSVAMEMRPPGTAEEEDESEPESQPREPSIRVTSHLQVSPDADTISVAPSIISVAPSALSQAPPEIPEPPEGRGLRRRPGGNLRGVSNINDLELQPRAHSVGSIGTGTYTIDSFGPTRVLFQRPFSPASRSTVSDAAHLDLATLSIGATGGRGMRGSIMGHHGGLLPPWDHPSRTPDPQPTEEEKQKTFTEGVQLLRDIPDDSSDDGGFDVALRKLNGTYERKTSKAQMSPQMQKFRESFAETLRRSGAGSLPGEELGLGLDHVQTLPVIDDAASGNVDHEDEEEGPFKRWEERKSNRARHRHKQVVDHVPLETPPLMDGPTSFINTSIASASTSASSSSDSSVIPGRNSGDTRSSNVLPSNSGFRSNTTSTPNLRSAPTSEDLRAIDNELNRLANHRSERRKHDFESSIGSSSNSTFPPVNSGTIISELSGTLGSHPLRHPPSPPLTLEQALSLSPGRSMPSNFGRARNGTLTTTTGTLPTITATAGDEESEFTTTTQLLEPTPTHLPFILAYDSELLARQFTLIEKDALQEVDWKELVELSWGRAVNTEVRDWVDVLNLKVIKGVELAILRFNLMTRWATSTLLLTLSPHERARTISKLIHIAAHSRRIHNFATMYQLTIALLTTSVARLKYTWSLVPEADKRTLRDMERLLQPVGNFAALRREVELAEAEVGGGGLGGTGDEGDGIGIGVVPFVGLFTHDLIKNAQRPLLIPAVIPTPARSSSPTPCAPNIATPSFPSSGGSDAATDTATASTEKRTMLVNFERHRATAGIVKRLLKMVEAGREYGIEPVDGVCERCLWLGALGERELEGLSLGIAKREDIEEAMRAEEGKGDVKEGREKAAKGRK